ncbi:MAG TPA: hypothetical protein VHB02_04740 [Acidimicrobiales bacterium]|nr:hypothetical protein [Acidimicrobiales bacterium]
MASDTAPKRRRLRKLREAPARFVARIPWLRRRQARRLVKTMERYREKNRPLPENLSRLEKQLRRLPKNKRAEAVEQMMEMSVQPDQSTNRALRRASGRQERQKGTKGGGLRPGTLPGQRQRQGPAR